MPGPRATILTRPTGRATVQVNQVKLTPVTMLIICKEAGQNVVRIRALLQAFKTTNPQVRVGVGLGGDSTNPRADVGHSRSNGQMTRSNGHTKAAIAGITGHDRKGHGSSRSSRNNVSNSTAVPAQHCSSLVNSAAE
ncbi:N-carbamoyl-L-amino acid amidohydrolase [Synechococcus sp. RS9916]|nr:N-carbamoyl-L-amino acid amidohydrolase [Synechococcus sp. RS9916]